jgi:transcriptional regulator with XRE-family HTH domain
MRLSLTKSQDPVNDGTAEKAQFIAYAIDARVTPVARGCLKVSIGENLHVSIKRPDERDIAVGRRIRSLRLERGMSQTALGGHLKLTFQQIQKYEKGSNRVGAGRLQAIAEVFGVPVSAFYADAGGNLDASPAVADLVETSSAMRLLRSYAQIADPNVQQAFLMLAESIAERE